ncbi:unnamed protein product [Effrenium voratum]|nr:unnamed protein product [Effrenium voratum]
MNGLGQLDQEPNTSRFARLLRELLEEHEGQQSMLRMEIQRLKEQTDTPERLELEIPCERRTGDEDCTALAIAEAS